MMMNFKRIKNSKVVLCLPIFAVFILISCNNESCSDGLKNQDETGVDCGGVCPSCETCTDGIQNQDETGVDCGGVCSPCETCSDGIQNQDETGVDCGGVCQPCSQPLCSNDEVTATIGTSSYNATNIQKAYQLGNLSLSTSDITSHTVNLQIDTAWVAGSYTISGSWGTSTTAGGQYSDLTAGSNLYEATSGTLTIVENDKTAKAMSATFAFDATQTTGGTGTVSITSGSFCVNY